MSVYFQNAIIYFLAMLEYLTKIHLLSFFMFHLKAVVFNLGCIKPQMFELVSGVFNGSNALFLSYVSKR